MRPAFLKSVDDLARELRAEPARGLSSAEAAGRLAEHGPNEIASARGRPPWKILLAQFSSPMVLLLIGVAVLSLAIGHLLDAAVVGVLVLLNAGIGFFQENRAEKAMQSLRHLAAPKATALRDGAFRRILARDLVPGDVIQIETGDRIPADVRLMEVARLQADESLLTGESAAVYKETAALRAPDLIPGAQTNMGFMGTYAVGGRGVGIVTATGGATELGKIASLLGRQKTAEVPLRRRLEGLTRQLSLTALFLCGALFGVGVWQGQAWVDMLLTAVSLAVAAIPEGLPAVITISLSLGSLRLARHGALVRHLPAVEALGSITVIAADKTGTLTENRMTVVYPGSGETVPEGFAETLVLCNDARLASDGKVTGDPMETALLKFASERGLNPEAVRSEWPRKNEIPFDAARKRMATLHAREGRRRLAVKGAPETVLPLCAFERRDGRDEPLSEGKRRELERLQESLAARGLRVLGVALRETQDEAPKEAEALEKELTFLGFAGLMDPPRAEAKAAIAECRSAGIRPVMITGDYGVTAAAIGRELGLYEEGGEIITGEDLRRERRGWLDERAAHCSVFARVTPEDKLAIIEVLKDRDEVVAMTGDGVNDAPALKRADVGIAMGRGTDVAKEAAAIILVKENFAAIVEAVREGRVIFDNIRKFVRYMLTTNFGEIAAMLIASLLGLPPPLLPLQILWVNLVTDGLPAVALGFEPAEGDVMARRPRPVNAGLLSGGLWQHTLWVGAFMGLCTAGLAFYGIFQDRPLDEVRTVAFSALTFAQMGHVLGIRSETRPLWKLGLRSNPRLGAAVLLTILSQLLLVYVPPVARLFHLVPLNAGLLALTFAPGLAVYALVEAEKFLRNRTTSHRIGSGSKQPNT